MTPASYPAPFKSAHVRARILKILLIVGAITTVLSVFAGGLSLGFPLSEDQELADNPVGAIVVLTEFLLGLAELALYLATVIFFCVWLYRAYDNLRAFNQWPRLEHSPGWAVASFFVPFVNLVIPYRAVREVWQKSGPSEEALLSAPNPPATFPVWWLFWLLASFTGNISMRASFNENIAESTATVISIVAGCLSIVAALLAYLVVDEIDDRQEETSRRIKLGKFSAPPPPPTNLPMPDVVATS
jgi:Domain of unknown function (DUF4328)